MPKPLNEAEYRIAVLKHLQEDAKLGADAARDLCIDLHRSLELLRNYDTPPDHAARALCFTAAALYPHTVQLLSVLHTALTAALPLLDANARANAAAQLAAVERYLPIDPNKPTTLGEAAAAVFSRVAPPVASNPDDPLQQIAILEGKLTAPPTIAGVPVATSDRAVVMAETDGWTQVDTSTEDDPTFDVELVTREINGTRYGVGRVSLQLGGTKLDGVAVTAGDQKHVNTEEDAYLWLGLRGLDNAKAFVSEGLDAWDEQHEEDAAAEAERDERAWKSRGAI
jgi:hypothetical protein